MQERRDESKIVGVHAQFKSGEGQIPAQVRGVQR